MTSFGLEYNTFSLRNNLPPRVYLTVVNKDICHLVVFLVPQPQAMYSSMYHSHAQVSVTGIQNRQFKMKKTLFLLFFFGKSFFFSLKDGVKD